MGKFSECQRCCAIFIATKEDVLQCDLQYFSVQPCCWILTQWPELDLGGALSKNPF